MFKNMKIGLALGAGGARGLAHIGVLKALEKAGITIHAIAGTSIGALIGACYAVTGNASDVERQVLDFIASKQFEESGVTWMRDAFRDDAVSWSERAETWLKKAYLQAKLVASSAVLNSEVYREIINYFIPKITIEQLQIPFCAMGTDMTTGRPVIFRSGPLQAAIYGSSAIPGVVKPLAVHDHLVVDGGVLSMVPVIPAREMGVDLVVGVDVEKIIDPKDDFSNALDLLFRVEDIQNAYLRQVHLQEADLVVKPQVGHIHWADFQRTVELIQLGSDAAEAVMDRITELANRKKYPWSRRKYSYHNPPTNWIEL